MSQPRNPFTITGALGLNHLLFRGRRVELSQLEHACLTAHDSFQILYAGRQSGKTSLLLRLEASLRAHLTNGVRVCRIDFQGLPGANSYQVYRHMARIIASSLPQAPQPPDTP